MDYSIFVRTKVLSYFRTFVLSGWVLLELSFCVNFKSSHVRIEYLRSCSPASEDRYVRYLIDMYGSTEVLPEALRPYCSPTTYVHYDKILLYIHYTVKLLLNNFYELTKLSTTTYCMIS